MCECMCVFAYISAKCVYTQLCVACCVASLAYAGVGPGVWSYQLLIGGRYPDFAHS